MTVPINLAILGATGSIGQQALSLAEAFPERIKITGLAAASSVRPLAKAIIKFRPQAVSVLSATEAKKLVDILKDLGLNKSIWPEIFTGSDGVIQVATLSATQTVLSAMVGRAGLPPTWAALKAGLKVLLANKESLVLAGELIRPMVDQIVPVDSEHSAIFQALGGSLTGEGIRRLILTASGGPFLGYSKDELKGVTKEMALSHPKWSMGPKISCDSATLMNKGLEVIEAHHLFGVDFDRIEVLVHPQSVVHSMVEFVDGSILAQMGPTDMRLPLAYSLSYNSRWPILDDIGSKRSLGIQPLDLTVSPLTFAKPDREVFRGLALAEAVGRQGGTGAAIMSGANEEAVGAFLAGMIAFDKIIPVVEECLSLLSSEKVSSLDDVFLADKKARVLAKEIMEKNMVN
ncbi:MAG: 1-deoxy-D-xylulose-5-phosphate reductoisomerase [Deltaproteobacteria bacterium]|jgi:1-deoxy-D-xylulose-5-phosphate reductoisomerase|nr:1-deoxy-D-xylulose-5-phosphate reductoisomerase [Deltaproteobacteria bacterium]